jgi:predicted nucleic acid-binding protein
MPKIISNTSCLIVLDNINALGILHKLYQNIYLTEEVAQEFGKPLENWMHVVTVIDKNYLRILNTSVDLGEASTIAMEPFKIAKVIVSRSF